jgi:exonuclease SbcC
MKISLTNFRKYKNQVFTLGNSVVKITGESGTGKSTILDSIYYVLYGKLQKVKPHDGKGQTEVILEFPYENTIITVRRRGRNDICVWIGEGDDTKDYEGDQAQGVIDAYFGNAESFLMSSYLKAESMHKFISATPAEKKEITYLLFPGVADCDKYTNALKEAKKREESLIEEQEKRVMRLTSSIGALTRSHPWLNDDVDIDGEDTRPLLPTYGMEEESTPLDVQKKMRECSSLYGKYQTLQEQCVVPTPLDVESVSNRIEEISSRLRESTTSYSDIQRRMGEASSTLSRYRTIKDGITSPPSDVEEYRKRLEEIDRDIEEKRREVSDDDLPTLADLQKKIRDCYSVLGRYSTLIEQTFQPDHVDVDVLQERIKELRNEMISSKVSTESRESKLSYLRGSLESLEQDYNPDCIADHDLTRRLHNLCPSYDFFKKKVEDLAFQIRENEVTLVDYIESIEAIEYNNRLQDTLVCPSCNASLHHTDILHLVSDNSTPRPVPYVISKEDVNRLRLSIDSMKMKMSDLRSKITDYDKLISNNPHIVALLDKHGSVVQYNRYITEMKNRKDRIDALTLDIEAILNDNSKYVSQDIIDVMNDECCQLEEKVSTYKSNLSRYNTLQTQISSLVERNSWLDRGIAYVRELESMAQRLNDLEIFLSSCRDEKESLISKISSYEEEMRKYTTTRNTLSSMEELYPWLDRGDEYIQELENECQSILDRQKEDERSRKEIKELESSLSSHNSQMSIYLSNKSKVDNLVSSYAWIEKGESYIHELDVLYTKMMDYEKKIEMKKVHTSYTKYKSRLAEVEVDIKRMRDRLDNLHRLLALVNEAHRIYVDGMLKDIEYDIVILCKIAFSEVMNVSLVADRGDQGRVPCFDLRIEQDGIVIDDIRTLSTGERKRLSIIMMIVIAKYLNARIMILDESFSNMQLESRGCLLNELSKLGIPLLVTSHDSIPGAYFEELDLDNLEPR